MKKGVFTVMHYFMPKNNILSLHSGCNVGAANDVSLFFGLSGARGIILWVCCKSAADCAQASTNITATDDRPAICAAPF